MSRDSTQVVAMTMDRQVCGDPATQKVVDSLQLADWVNYLAKWEVIAHLTFAWESSLDSGRRCYEKFMRKHLCRVSYFYSVERNPGRDGFHVHALWADAGSVFRKEAWAAWFKAYGRARIEPVRNQGDVSNYCSKYCTKDAAWWDVKLQWHRLQAMHGRKFELLQDPTRSGAPADSLPSSSPPGFSHAALGNSVATLRAYAPTMSPSGSGGQRHHTPGEMSCVDQAVWQNAGNGIWHQVDP